MSNGQVTLGGGGSSFTYLFFVEGGVIGLQEQNQINNILRILRLASVSFVIVEFAMFSLTETGHADFPF